MGSSLSSRSTDSSVLGLRPGAGGFADLSVSEILEQNLLGNAFAMQSLFAARGGDELGATATPTDFSTRAQALFSQIDADGNGFLSAGEIDAAVVDRSYRGPDAAVVATLNQLAGELEELSDDEWGDENDGPTLADLTAYERTGAVAGGLRERVEGRYAYGASRIAAGSPDLYGPTGVPDVSGVNQGLLGDCYFLAAVASVVAHDPNDITALIADNLDGTYTVTFPNQVAQTVSGPTDAELAQYAVSKGNGFWVTILEKAYGQIQSPGAAIPEEGADSGLGTAASGIAFLTGHSTNLDLLAVNERDTTRDRLTSAFADGRIVTAGIRNAMPWTNGRNDIDLPMGHAYSVIGWDAATEVLTLRNPWGHAERNDDTDVVDDGTFTMTLDEFLANFTTIAYEGSE
jgi:Calpain family cysteine protease